MRTFPSVLLLAIAALPSFARATATWCVHDSTELRQALADAATSSEDDEIRLREGVYVGNEGAFAYVSRNTASLSISGGWYSDGSGDCAQMRIDASRTVIDGDGVRQALRIHHMPPAGATQAAILSVANLSLRNGFGDPATFQRGGGLDMNSFSDAWTELHLDNLIVASNDGYFAGGANLYAKNGSVRIAGSLFDANRASTSSSAQVSISTNAISGVPQNVVIASSTFVSGRCAELGGRGCGVRVGLVAGAHLDVLDSLILRQRGFRSRHRRRRRTRQRPCRCRLQSRRTHRRAAAAERTTRARGRSALCRHGHRRFPSARRFAVHQSRPGDDSGVSIRHDRSRWIVAHALRHDRPGAYENQTWDFLFADSFEH